MKSLGRFFHEVPVWRVDRPSDFMRREEKWVPYHAESTLSSAQVLKKSASKKKSDSAALNITSALVAHELPSVEFL